MYVWQNAEQYKNDALIAYQQRLHDRGVTDTKIYVAQLIQENGRLDPSVLGDHGCSFGVIQYNACAKHGINAKTFLERNPEWKQLGTQLDWMADQVAERERDYRSQWSRVVDHNCPACATYPNDPKWGPIGRRYFRDVSSRISLLSVL